jgi:hypothetical protein
MSRLHLILEFATRFGMPQTALVRPGHLVVKEGCEMRDISDCDFSCRWGEMYRPKVGRCLLTLELDPPI